MKLESKIDHRIQCEKLYDLLKSVKHLEEFKDSRNQTTFLISESNDALEYGIEFGCFYPSVLSFNIIRRLKSEGKELPVAHKNYESLEYHVNFVHSKDYEFIYDIASLPI